MDYQKSVSQFQVNDAVEGFYILKGATAKVASNGRPFLTVTLSDKTGSVEGKVWDYGGPIGAGDEGAVVKIRGSVGEFRGMKQVTVERIRLAELSDPVDPAALVPVAPIQPEQMLKEVESLLQSIADPDYRAVALELLRRHRETFAKIPAAKSVHHGFLQGLMMHTGNMLKAADFFAGLYTDTVDRSLLLTGVFAHDLEKETEFVFSQLGMVTEYSLKGQLLGHLVMGAQEAADAARTLGIPEEKTVLLEHMILSHHGEPEFGAAVRPMCAEAELLYYLDTIDSRMEIYRETFLQMEPGEFSGRIFALEKRIYKHTLG